MESKPKLSPVKTSITETLVVTNRKRRIQVERSSPAAGKPAGPAGLDLEALLRELDGLMEETPDPLEGVDLDALLAELTVLLDGLALDEGGNARKPGGTLRRKRKNGP